MEQIKKALLKSKIESICGGIASKYHREQLFAWLSEGKAFQYDTARRLFFEEDYEKGSDAMPYYAIFHFFEDIETLRQCKLVWESEGFGVSEDCEWDLLNPVESWLKRQIQGIAKGGTVGLTPYDKECCRKYWQRSVVEGGTLITRLQKSLKNITINWNEI